MLVGEMWWGIYRAAARLLLGLHYVHIHIHIRWISDICNAHFPLINNAP